MQPFSSSTHPTPFKFSPSTLSLALSGLLLAQAALAANNPPDAGQLLNEQQQLNKARQTRPLQPRNDEAARAATDSAGEGFKVLIQRIRFSAAEGLATPEELQSWVADARGQRLNHAQLQALAARVSAQLQAKGYSLARAYLPRQDLSEGELEIAVLAGQLERGAGRIQLHNRSALPDAQLRAVADAALPEGPVRGDDLERALLLMNDLAGVVARSSLEKGEQLGSSRLVVRAEGQPALRGQASLDNFSNRYTGQARAAAQLAWANPAQRGDLLGLSLSATEGNRSAALSYALPLTPQGLRLNLGASALRYRVGEEMTALDLRGTARSLGAGLSFPLQRSRMSSAWAQLDAESKRLQDDSANGNLRQRRVDRLQAQINGSRWDELGQGGATEWQINASVGRVDLSGNAADQGVDALSARTQGSFSKATARLARLQTLDAAGSWSVYASLSAQLAGRNLDSSEKFMLGGPSGVRAYAIGEASGDAGWLGSAELRHDFRIGERLRAQGLAFVDGGRIQRHAQPWAAALPAGQSNGYKLAGAGLGLNLYGGEWQLRAAWSRAIGSNEGLQNGRDSEGRSARSRLWLQASLNF
ncbi:ShlB/FhaC/HecB family hemolysin secretion/activation protein [Kinneretia aquatilis]|uniref:ShlB/FhaC/HecB family hemolysin secretion/activation protein n=1 Tax=Kinneretia aquatilis TaxID=2070761 RepID=UPI0014952148|nr:ShlB/FhaC/HecB family hemolysin secretion/activation protein [Paucibacter aquatile]WIV99117.1 ShlB/FhaC/HecB family hemolysin secretion/activation protein [Paucibacter aquatile]